MYCDITNRISLDLERKWMRKLAAVNALLDDTKGLQDYMRVLQNESKWNSLSFSLRRYVYLHFTARGEEEPSCAYQVQFDGKTYNFSPVSPGEDVTEEELRAYADLLYRMTRANKCFDQRPDGSWDEKKGAVQKQQYLNYLSGKRPYRKNLFPLAVALGFTAEEMEHFMNVLGESPACNFRSAEECIYYFCLSVPSLRNTEMVDQLMRRFAQIEETAEEGAAAGAGMTAILRSQIDTISADPRTDAPEKLAAFIAFLEENVQEFTDYSKTARELLLEEIYTPERLLDVRKTETGSRLDDLFQKSRGVPQQREGSLDSRGDELFGELIADGFDDEEIHLKELQLDRRLTANLPDGAHFRSALFDENDRREQGRKTEHEHVTKQDFLLQRLYKLGRLIEYGDYTEEERLELVRRFHRSTDRILAKAGLPPIYIANLLDHLVLSALCTEAPLAFMRQIFCRAPRKRRKKDGKK